MKLTLKAVFLAGLFQLGEEGQGAGQKALRGGEEAEGGKEIMEVISIHGEVVHPKEDREEPVEGGGGDENGAVHIHSLH